MIKTNLIKRESVSVYHAGKLIVPILSAILFIQLVALGFKHHEAVRMKDRFSKAQQSFETVKAEVKKFEISENLRDLAGKVAERNNWWIDRRNSPLTKLGKLQKDCPNNVQFSFYGGDISSGKIELSAPDLNSVTSWLNGHFNNCGNISVIGRDNGLLMIQFIWSE